MYDNVERFSFGGAAAQTVCEVSGAGIRAGERKTCCAKALPPPPGLWALNARGSFSCVPRGILGN